MSLHDKISGLETDANEGTMVSLAAVLDLVKGAVAVEVDARLHDDGPTEGLDHDEQVLWPLLDTAYNLLREAAMRTVLMGLREKGALVGIALNETDDQMIATARRTNALPDGYDVRGLLYDAFAGLVASAEKLVVLDYRDGADDGQ